MLRDLVLPERSPLYTTSSFKESGAQKGVFKTAFLNALSKGDYPVLKAEFKSGDANYRTTDAGIGGSESIDTTHEIWTNSDGISIYFPYSDNFPWIDPNALDNSSYGMHMVTIVAADRDADSGPGSQPYLSPIDPNDDSGDGNVTLSYREVIVDDAYAESNPVHIIGVGAEPSRTMPANPPPAVNVVFIGDVKCMTQFDHLISFTGNGGGSELKFCRGSGYLTQDGNGQITNPQNVVSVYPTRSQIRNHKWLTINQIWDADWQAANLNQVFAIYEEDTQGSVNLSLSSKTTIKIGSNVTGEGTVGFGWSFKTQDDIIRQLAWSRESFFQYNQGTLNNGCGTRNGFTEYDCTSPVRYTMPTQ